MAGASLTKAAWYWNRISAMSVAEIIHRAIEAAKRRLDRRASSARQGLAQSRANIPLPTLPGLRERFDAWDIPANLMAEWRRLAERAIDGHFTFLGQDWPECPLERRWHLDPTTGRAWPSDRFCFDIDYRHTSQFGDVKYVWEINRLQYLQPIAALAGKQRDPALARFCIAQIESWIDCNPPYQGVSWGSGIEIALRAVSIVIVGSFVAEQVSDAEREKIVGTLAAMARWLERYPSLFSSANNHRVAEGLGLFAIGALTPGLDGAERWKRTGWTILCEAAERQILADGVGAEQTVTYTAVVLEMLLLGCHLARAVGIPIPPLYLDRLARGGEWLRWLTDAAGNQPRIGDDDDASVVGIDGDSESHTRSVMACIAALLGRAELVPPGLELDFRQGAMGIPPAPAPGPLGIRTFELGGYTVGRWKGPAGDALLAIDHGYLGYLAIAAHGHADALAIWLHIGGQPVLVDAGTYLYHSGGKWRSHFRGTAAHNTLRVEQADSSTISGPFNWSQKAVARLVSVEERDGGWSIEAEQDGYRKRFGVVHRRRVDVAEAHGVRIADSLIGSSRRSVEIGFLIHPSLAVTRRGDTIEIAKDQRTILRFRSGGPLECIVGEPGSTDGGWYSHYFGAIEPTHRIVLRGTLGPGQTNICSLDLIDLDP